MHAKLLDTNGPAFTIITLCLYFMNMPMVKTTQGVPVLLSGTNYSFRVDFANFAASGNSHVHFENKR